MRRRSMRLVPAIRDRFPSSRYVHSSTIGHHEFVEPDVIKRSWARIAEDVRSTTGRQLVVELLPGSDGWWDISAYLDGKKVRGGGRVLSAENEQEVGDRTGGHLSGGVS
jgi:hypothetical protein